MQHPIEILAQALQNKTPSVLATVVEVKSASPAKVIAKLLIREDGSTAEAVGEGNLEASFLQNVH